MEKALKLLNRISRIIDLNIFYTIDIRECALTLQGHAKTESTNTLERFFSFEYKNQMLQAKRYISGIEIDVTLTL